MKLLQIITLKPEELLINALVPNQGLFLPFLTSIKSLKETESNLSLTTLSWEMGKLVGA